MLGLARERRWVNYHRVLSRAVLMAKVELRCMAAKIIPHDWR
jgi:hypothetical protein